MSDYLGILSGEMSEAIIRIADASEKLLSSGLTKRGLIVLLHDTIGVANINKGEIESVLDALPQLKHYVDKGKSNE